VPGTPLTIRILATQLPGRTFADYHDVRVGVQLGKSVHDLVAGDAPRASWDVAANAVVGKDGARALRGEGIHGPKGERFLYLVWVARAASGEGDQMFRRAKLQLDGVPEALLTRALDGGMPLVAKLALTDQKGGPLCASVRPPLIAWSV
jgi:hypothetical protein